MSFILVPRRSKTFSLAAPFHFLPTERITTWDPGLYAVGGIPNRTTIFTTLSTLGAGVNNATQIQSALDSCPANQVVKLNAGDYGLSGGVIIPTNGVVLRGSGAGSTRLIKLNGANATTGQGTSPSPAVTISKVNTLNLDQVSIAVSATGNITSGAGNGAKGTFTVTVDSVTGFSAGQIVRVDRASNANWQNDPRFVSGHQIWASSDYLVTWNKHNPLIQFIDDFAANEYPTDNTWYNAFMVPDRAVCEMKEISAIDAGAKTITFSTPLHTDYMNAVAGRVTLYNGTMIDGCGIEDLTATGFDLGTFEFKLAARCWMKNLECDNWFDKPFHFMAAFRCEMRHCYQHGTPWPSNSAENYAFNFNWASADCLVEDCISIMCDKVFAARAAGAGCVAGYNYLDMGFIGDNFGGAGWVEIHANASHLTGPHHVLFEGNYAANADSDFTHGNSTNITHFRNHYAGFRRSYVDPGSGTTHNDLVSSDGVKRCAAMTSFGYWHSFVGNVLGLSGQMSGWTYEGFNIFADKSVWLLGWDPTQTTGTDPKVVDSAFAGHVIRDGNWDWLNSQQRWHETPGTFAIPNSLYLNTKPSFFGANTWPWVDPSNGTTYALPAKARYDAGTPNI